MALQQEDLLADRHATIDSVSFTELYKRYHVQLFRFVARRVNDPHVAEELTQETFYRALAGLGSLRDHRRFYPWVRTIAWRLVIDHYQVKARVQPMATVRAGLADAPDEGLLREAERQEIRIAFSRVPQRQRDVLQLREQEELSYDEIAARLGARITTVPPLLHRARHTLRREYQALLEQERIAAIVPAWLGLVDLVRRLRERTMQVATYFPDAHALSGSVTAVAVSMGSLLGLTGQMLMDPMPGVAVVHARSKASAFASTPSPAAAQSLDVQEARTAPVGSDDAGPSAIGPLPRYATDVTTDERTEAENRAHDRQMPYYLEGDQIAIGLDHERGHRIVEHTLAGDLEWMERE